MGKQARAIAGFWGVSYLMTGYMPPSKLTFGWLLPNVLQGWTVPRIWDWVLGPLFSVIFVVLFTSEKMKNVINNHGLLSVLLLMGLTFFLGISVGGSCVANLGPSHAANTGLLAGSVAGILAGWLINMSGALSFALGIGLSAGIFAELSCGAGLIVGFFSFKIGRALVELVFSEETWRKFGRWLIAKDKKDQIP